MQCSDRIAGRLNDFSFLYFNYRVHILFIMTPREVSKKKLKEVLKPIIEKYPIEVIYLFGSKAEPRRKPNDIDIGILLDEKKKKSKSDFGDEIEIEVFLQKALKLYEKIDVKILNGRNPLFVHEVITPQEILYKRDIATKVNFEVANYYKCQEELFFRRKLRFYQKENNE